MAPSKETKELFIDDIDQFTSCAKALASPARVNILKFLQASSLNLAEIAQATGQPLSSTSQNIKILEEAGLICTNVTYTSSGKSRICFRTCDGINLILFERQRAHRRSLTEHSIPIGSFSSYGDISSPCGMAGKLATIGYDDDLSVFYHPLRHKAQILWFTAGSLEYRVPLSFTPEQQLNISFEACSEAPSYNNDYPSDITLWINDTEIGTWTCPGDMGGRRGQFSPEYWPDSSTQYGFLLNWQIEPGRSSLNNEFISYANLSKIDFKKYPYLSIRIGVKKDAKHCGGMNLFGKDFGDYQQDIIVRYL